ncbi:MAG TPA: hypothetical protein VFJ96_12150 [Gemmatimonadaceae bacterium]|nr:hypothetical protein [Gemmatimonadaceae bacterium]
MRMHIGIRSVMVATCAALLVACGHDSPTQPSSHDKTVRPSVPGVLTVQLTTPHSDDAALLVTVNGSGISDVQAPSGMLLHVRQRGDTVTAALFGRIASGEVLHFSVPDVNDAAHYTAHVVQVADSTNVVRGDVEGYVVTVER